MNSGHKNKANAEAEAKAKAEAKAARCKLKEDAKRDRKIEEAKAEAAEEAALNAIAQECSDELRRAIDDDIISDTEDPTEAEYFLIHNVDNDELERIVNYYGNLETIFDLAEKLLEKINEEKLLEKINE